MKPITTFLYFISLLSIVLMLSGCSSGSGSSGKSLLDEVKNRGYLLIGVKYDSPPFGYVDKDGQLKGFEIDLAHELASEILDNPEAVRFVQVNTATRVPALKARQLDFILATMTITPERKKAVTFTEPYYISAQRILIPENSPAKSIADLKDKRIAYIIGSTGDERLKRLLPEAQLLGYRSPMDAFSAFNAGRADAMSTDDTVLYSFLHEYCGLKMLPDKLSEEPYGIAFRQEEIAQPLHDKVQEVLDGLQRNGSFDILAEKWTHSKPARNCKPLARPVEAPAANDESAPKEAGKTETPSTDKAAATASNSLKTPAEAGKTTSH